MVLNITIENKEWLAKPDRDFGRLQLDLYNDAFKLNEKMFDCPLELMLFDNRTYVSKESWSELIKRLSSLTLNELSEINNERINSVNSFLDDSKNFIPDKEGFNNLFHEYSKAVSYFHIRWNYGKEIEKRLIDQFKLLNPKLKNKSYNIIRYRPQLETLLSADYFNEILSKIQLNSDYKQRFISSNTQLMNEIKNIPEIWEKISYLAEQYMHIHNEDIRIKIPYEYVAKELKEHINDSIKERVKPDIKQIDEDLIRNSFKGDWKDFYQLLNIAVIQGIQKENEHHFQIRGQNNMKKEIDKLGEYLSSKNKLSDPSEIYELPKESFLQLIPNDYKEAIKC